MATVTVTSPLRPLKPKSSSRRISRPDTITLTARQVALTLSIVMRRESPRRLAKATNTTPDDLQRIASNELAPTAGVLAYFDFQRSGRKYAWQLDFGTNNTGESHD